MDALGLALSLAASSGLRILAAGNGIPAPSDAQFAIFCVSPQTIASGDSDIVVQEQAYIVSKGNICSYYGRSSNGFGGNLSWTYGSTSGDGSVVYLG